MPVKPPTYLAPGQVRFKSERERKAAIDRRRPSPAERGYDKDWYRFRHTFLLANPKCCETGCDRKATEVDHIQSVKDRPDLRLIASNCRPFCKSHHSARTAREQGFGCR